jgi:superfamily II DNA or RNA helicase
MIPTLRPYQLRANEAIFSGWDAGINPLAISAATGAGKSVIFGGVSRQHLEHRRADGPVVLIAHRRELITQAAEHFRRANPDLRVEVVIGSPGPVGSNKRIKTVYRWRAADVLVTTVQTLAPPNTMRDFPLPSLVIVDEAHHSPAPQWKKVLTALGCFSGTRTLGVTATPFREDYRDFSDVWQKIVYAIDIGWLITHRSNPETGEEETCEPGDGYLVPPRLRHLIVDGLDLSEVPTSQLSGAVDFRDGDLAEAMEEAGAFEMIAKVIVDELSDKRGAIFAPTVASSKHLAEIMTGMGASCGHVDGMMDAASRDKVINDFRERRIQWLSNVGIISEGFDMPEIDTVVLARPTRSRIFFRQAIGRALRPAPGKRYATVLDVAGASDGHSLAGVEALTDVDVLDAQDGESLTALLDRSDRARRGVKDRITAHRDDIIRRQEQGERAYEQIRITAETYISKLPILGQFVEKATPIAHSLMDATTAAVDLSNSPKQDATMDELTTTEKQVADTIKVIQQRHSRLESLKTHLREALLSLREDPDGEVAKAVITGYAGTVGGTLFGEEDERSEVNKPQEVGGLKIKKKGGKTPKPVFVNRYGWSIRSSQDHLYAAIHGGKDIRGLAIAAKIGESSWWPVVWMVKDNSVTELTTTPVNSEADAYKAIIVHATEKSSNPNLLNPNAKWRKNPASDTARAVAFRSSSIAAREGIPDDATAGFVSDLIDFGKHNVKANAIAEFVAKK